MKLKTLAMSAAIAGSVAVGATLASTPANALGLNFGGSNRLLKDAVAIGQDSILDFKLNLTTSSNNNAAWGITANRQLISSANINNPTTTITPGTGTATLVPETSSLFGSPGDTITLTDLTLRKTSIVGTGVNQVTTWVLQNPLANFITGLSGGAGSFSLDTFVLKRTNAGLSADYSGTFANIDPLGVGTYTSQGTFTNFGGTSFSSTLAIPTPALLPGLIGFGVAALRKRKGEASTEAEPETVEIEA